VKITIKIWIIEISFEGTVDDLEKILRAILESIPGKAYQK